MIRKIKRLDLVSKHGIRDIRELEFSTVVVGAFNELKDIAETNRVKQHLVLSTIKDVCRREQKIYSMYAELDVMTKTLSLLHLRTDICQYQKKINGGKDIPGNQTALDKTKQIFCKRLNEENRLCKLYQEYQNIQ